MDKYVCFRQTTSNTRRKVIWSIGPVRTTSRYDDHFFQSEFHIELGVSRLVVSLLSELARPFFPLRMWATQGVTHRGPCSLEHGRTPSACFVHRGIEVLVRGYYRFVLLEELSCWFVNTFQSETQASCPQQRQHDHASSRATDDYFEHVNRYFKAMPKPWRKVVKRSRRNLSRIEHLPQAVLILKVSWPWLMKPKICYGITLYEGVAIRKRDITVRNQLLLSGLFSVLDGSW